VPSACLHTGGLQAAVSEGELHFCFADPAAIDAFSAAGFKAGAATAYAEPQTLPPLPPASVAAGLPPPHPPPQAPLPGPPAPLAEEAEGAVADGGTSSEEDEEGGFLLRSPLAQMSEDSDDGRIASRSDNPGRPLTFERSNDGDCSGGGGSNEGSSSSDGSGGDGSSSGSSSSGDSGSSGSSGNNGNSDGDGSSGNSGSNGNSGGASGASASLAATALGSLPSSPRRHLLVKNAVGRPMAGKGPRASPGLPAEAALSYDVEAAETSPEAASPEAASPAAPGSRTRWSNSSAAARNSPGDQARGPITTVAPYGTAMGTAI